jgi:hypothetical protein
LDVLWRCWHIYFSYNILNEAWVPMHVIVGLFEVHESSRQSMAIQLQSFIWEVWIITLNNYLCKGWRYWFDSMAVTL